MDEPGIVRWLTERWGVIVAISVAVAGIASLALTLAKLRNEFLQMEEHRRKRQLDELSLRIRQDEVAALNALIHRPTPEEVKKYTETHPPPHPMAKVTPYSIVLVFWVSAKLRCLVVALHRSVAYVLVRPFIILYARTL